MQPLSIPAECQSCGRVFIHVRGQSGHVCEVCGGHVACGYLDCEAAADKRRAAVLQVLKDAGRLDCAADVMT